MAVLAVAAVGAVAGTSIAVAAGYTASTLFLGATAGAWGWAAGSIIGSMLFTEGQDGPRITDRNIGGQSYGSPMWKPYGTIRGGGQIIFASDLIEHESSSGKGKRSGTTYSYTADCAVAICEGPIDAVIRIWANGILIYGANSNPPTDTSAIVESGVTIYLGDESQTPSAMIEGYKGAGNVPAYRGTAYVTFEGLELARFGNRLPNFEFEVTTNATAVQVPTTRTKIAYPLSPADATTVSEGTLVKIDGGFIVGANGGKVDEYSDSGTFVRTINSSITGKIAHTYGGRYVWRAGGNVQFERIDLLTGTTIKNAVLSAFLTTDIMASPTDASELWFQAFSYNTIGRVAVDPDTGTIQRKATSEDFYIQGGAFFSIDFQRKKAFSTYLYPNQNGSFFWSNGLVEYGLQQIAEAPTSAVEFIDVDQATHRLVASINLNGSGIRILDGTTFASLAYFPMGTNGRPQFNRVAGTWLCPSAGQVFEIDADKLQIVRTYTTNFPPDSWDIGDMVGAENGGFYSVDAVTYFSSSGSAANADGISHYTSALNKWFAGFDGTNGNAVTLSSVVTDLLESSGLTASTDFDVSALAADSIRGYMRTRPMSARAAIEPLQAAFAFDLPEIDYKLQAIKRGQSADVTFAYSDLIDAGKGDASVEIRRAEDLELPRLLTVSYLDASANYDAGVQDARREVTSATGRVALELPMVLTSSEARRAAHSNLSRIWMGRDHLKWSASAKYLRLNPASSALLPLPDGSTRRVQISKVTADRAIVEFEGALDDAANYVQTATGVDRGELPPYAGILPVDATRLVLMDTPLIADTDNSSTPNLYWAGARDGLGRWTGSVLFRSSDSGANYSSVGATNSGATMGVTASALPAWTGGNVFDRAGYFDVTLQSGTLSSASELAVLGGANLAYVGGELVGFASATLLSGSTWRLSNLLRGRRGTEYAMAAHEIGEPFVMLNYGIQAVSPPFTDVGVAIRYKAVTIGTAISDTVYQSASIRAMNLRPLSPVHLSAQWSAGDLVISWVRRTRIGGDWRDLIDVPVSEYAQSFAVDIYDSTFATRKRVISAASTTVTYTAANIAADFGTAPASVGVRVYQVSDSVGRGCPGKAVLPGGLTVSEPPDNSSATSAA